MSLIEDTREREWTAASEASPFAEAMSETGAAPAAAIGFSQFSRNITPFAEAPEGAVAETEAETMLAEAFAELHDEAFDEAVAFLAEETEQAVADRFTSESPASAAERERYADAQLSSVRFEAEQYLQALEQGLEGMDLESLTGDQLDEVLERFEPETGELTPAGEEFIGGLIRKAKKVVKTVVNTAKKVGKLAGNVVIGPILKKLRGLINPLLRRVLSFAIGRLPAPLQAPARMLAAKITSEAEELEGFDEAPMSPANLTDVEALAESFDGALAEAMTYYEAGQMEAEDYDAQGEAAVESRELELLAEARGALIDQFRAAGDEEDLAPAVEQFVPILLGALRLGINLVGRPKVVNFLAGYLATLIGKWVGPQFSRPLSNAIVDTGLRLISLEAEGGDHGEGLVEEAAPVALASVVEDTVRRLAENEEYVFEDEDLMQLAAAEAFSQAVATHFPSRYVRPGLQQAPSLGGTFVARRPRSVRTYHKYSRAPDVEISAQVADALPTFGGSTLGAVLRAAGATFPIRARMHIYQAAVGTTVSRMVRHDRRGGGRGYIPTGNVHPLTPAAAGLLLREPALGAAVPSTFLRSPRRVAVGQRFYRLEPTGEAAMPAPPASRAVAARLAPSRAWIAVDRRQARITVGMYLAETEAQRLVGIIRQGSGEAALLQALSAAFRDARRKGPGAGAPAPVARAEGEEFEEFAGRLGKRMPEGFRAMLRRRLGAWVLPALAKWARQNGEAFARAAAHPDAGVTVRVHLSSVPGLNLLGAAAGAQRTGQPPAGAMSALRGTPAISVTVAPGKRRA